MKILNLYAGLGGNRKLWGDEQQVTAVEMDPRIAAVYRRLYPQDTVIEGDAHGYLLMHYGEFDFIWSSPPCQSHSKMARFTRHKVHPTPDPKLMAEIEFLRDNFKGEWVVENVRPYYTPQILWNAEVDRHVFWSNFAIPSVVSPPKPKGFINLCNLKGKQAMMDWLGIHYPENIYYGTNHCPAQILRNCVHPVVGAAILRAALDAARSGERK